jgi:hypothetical protein
MFYSEDIVRSSASIKPELYGPYTDYTFEWKSNQVGATMDITIYPVDGSKAIVVNNITDHQYHTPLRCGDAFSLNIKYTEPVPNPEIYLAIYKTSDEYADEGLLYEQEVESSGFGLTSFITRDGTVK